MGMSAFPFPAVGDRLERISSAIEATIRDSVASVRGLSEHLRDRRGQMVRPGLLLACADLFGSRAQARALPLAEMVELIHYASVLHDQGLALTATVAALGGEDLPWGRREAILLGDLLLSRAMTLLAEHGGPREVARVARITGDLAEGQLLQVSLEREDPGAPEVREGKLLRVAELRTARFLGHTASLAVPDPEVAASVEAPLEAYGKAMGFAYHLWKDLRDDAECTSGGLPRARRLADARGFTDEARAALLPVASDLPVDPLVAWTDTITRELEALEEDAA